jgi:glycerophosphoryl diester phosphodiesterase
LANETPVESGGAGRSTRHRAGGLRTPLFAAALLAVLGFTALRHVPAPAPRAEHPFFAGAGPLVFAHRGGSALWPENTLHAFRAAAALGVDVLEMDVRRSADGHLVVFHDADLERTTEGRGALAEHALAELSGLDAGYHFSRDGGLTFPFRGEGLRISSVDEVLDALPEARINLELKTPEPGVGEALCTLVRRRGAELRVLVASFHQEPIDAFRTHCPAVATAATPGEAWRFYAASTLRLPNLARPRAAALQVFERLGPLTLVTPRLVSHASALRIPVHVWAVEKLEDVERLIAVGVAGVMTDRPDEVLALLGRDVGPM